MKTRKKKHLVPADIELPERKPLDTEGTLFVRLRTLDALQEFWEQHQEQFAYACQGVSIGEGDAVFLREYEWVFGTSKSAVVRTVMRWGQSGIRCEFFDWARAEPDDHAAWFRERDAYRACRIEQGVWTEADEAEHQADCARHSPDTYRGWWRYANVPEECGADDLIGDRAEELIDQSMPIGEVEDRLHAQTFDCWQNSDWTGIGALDKQGMQELITYWRKEQAEGAGYYGDENESASRAAT